MKSVSFVKHQAISQYINVLVSKQPNSWKIYLESVKTEDAGTSPIVTAFQSKQYDLLKFFIECSVNVQPLFEHATLEDICQLEKVSFIQQFINHNQLHTTQINYGKVFDAVVKLGNTYLIIHFLNYHQIPSKTLEKALSQACQQGSHDMVNLLIQHDESLVKAIQHDSSDHCEHPPCIAIRNSDVSIAIMLYKSGAQLVNVSSSENPQHHILCEDSLLNLCSRQDELSDILPRLLPKRIHQDTLTSALIAACEVGCTRAARLLVSKGADVKRCDSEGNSPLCAAIEAQSSQLVTLLLTAGANPNTASPDLNSENEHRTALCIACEGEAFEIASKLTDAGADTNPESCSPLLEACKVTTLTL